MIQIELLCYAVLFHDPSIVPLSFLTSPLNLSTFLAVLFLQDNVEFWHFLVVAPVSAKGMRGWEHLWNNGSFAVDILYVFYVYIYILSM